MGGRKKGEVKVSDTMMVREGRGGRTSKVKGVERRMKEMLEGAQKGPGI